MEGGVEEGGGGAGVCIELREGADPSHHGEKHGQGPPPPPSGYSTFLNILASSHA